MRFPLRLVQGFLPKISCRTQIRHRQRPLLLEWLEQRSLLAPIIALGTDNCCSASGRVLVVDQTTGLTLADFAPYEIGSKGGIRVAMGDLNGDGIDEIVTAPGRSLKSELRVFTLEGVELPEFRTLAYDAAYIGGAQVTVADVNGDGWNDLITVPTEATISTPARVRVFLNQTPSLDNGWKPINPTPHRDFPALPTVVAGAVVSAADMGRVSAGTFTNDLDGKAEIVVGTGAGTQATVYVYDVSKAGPYLPVRTFQPFTAIHTSFMGGVSLDVARMDSDFIPDIVVGAGYLGKSRVEVWTWNTSTASLGMLGAIPSAFTDSSNYADVRVAATNTNGDGIADTIVTLQGANGTTGQIHPFHITNLAPFTVVPNSPLTGFPGGYFVATIAPLQVVPPAPMYQNPTIHEDVIKDGKVTPIDALMVINFVNLGQPLPPDPVPPAQPQYYWDVDGNDAVTASDVLGVIHRLNSQNQPAGESEYVAAATPGALLGTADAAPAAEAPVSLPRLPNVFWRVPSPERAPALVGLSPLLLSVTDLASRIENPPVQLAKAVPPLAATARSAALFDILGAANGHWDESGWDESGWDESGWDESGWDNAMTDLDGAVGGKT